MAFQQPMFMGFSTEDPKFRANINLEKRITFYSHAIVESRGSIATYGTMIVRGRALDLDALSVRHRGKGIRPGAFCQWLQGAAERA